MNDIDVIYQHPDFWVVVKPENESFHSESGVGFAQRLQNLHPDVNFFPIHRLDKMTSGVMLFATNKAAASEFGKMFQEHRFEKRYLAISNAKPKKKQGTIAGAMEPSRRGQWRLTNHGEHIAVTQFFSFTESGKRCFFIRPLTGKTHQIRVALKSLGAPILGDTRYGAEASDRGYLHAYSMAFEWAGEVYNFSVWPTRGEFFNEQVQSQYQQQFFEATLAWPKFTIPKKLI